MSLFADWPEICRANVPLAPLTWFRVGGPAEWLIEPRDENELTEILHRCRECAVPIRFLGLGANLLVRDEGVRGAVIRLSGPHFESITISGGSVDAGAGAPLTKLVRATVDAGLAGLEVLAGIPGTVGGGIRMNCGGKYGEIGSAVERARLVLSDGQIVERGHEALGFEYRKAGLCGAYVVGARFRLTPTDAKELRGRHREIWRYKSQTQPALEEQSAGCIFKNPGNGHSAGKLIDEAGMKGLRCGGAEVSPQHANFIVLDPGAKAADVLTLIEQVQDRVYSRTGIRLEREVEVW